MSIISIDTMTTCDDGSIYVSAMIEDAVMTHTQTMEDPAEYGPALCEASFTIDDEELREVVLPDNDDELIQFLNDLDLNWELVDNSDYYFD